MKVWTVVITVVLIGIVVVGCATNRTKSNKMVEGGVTDRTDKNAPKEIQSQNIVTFKTYFYEEDRYDYDMGGIYDIEISDNDREEHVLTVSGAYNHTLVVSNQVLVDIQEIIDRYNLVQKNGVDRVTAGLPYEPWMLEVTYDSGEKLYFHINAEIESEWSKAFRDYFVDLMADEGFEDAIPSRDAVTITTFSVAFDIYGEYHSYEVMNSEEENQDTLRHSYEDAESSNGWKEETADVSDEFLQNLQSLIHDYRIDVLPVPRLFVNPPETEGNEFLKINLEYANGRYLDYEYEVYQIPAEWSQAKEALIEFLNSYLAGYQEESMDMLDGDYTYVDNELLMEMIEGEWVCKEKNLSLIIRNDDTVEIRQDDTILLNSPLYYVFLQPGPYMDVDLDLETTDLKDKDGNELGEISLFYTQMDFEHLEKSILCMELTSDIDSEELYFER